MVVKLRAIVGSVLAVATCLLVPVSANAKPVCGWYAIALCSGAKSDAVKFANRGWGSVIRTNDYAGFAPGYYCVVSGPQPRASAMQDRRYAINSGVSNDTYIKRACTDEANVGD
jgi:hypothetical protein